MSVNKIPIPGMLKSSVPDGHVVGAADVLDESVYKNQQTINAEIVKHIPLGALLDVSPTVEQSSAAAYTEGYLYSYVWDVTESRLLLKVTNPLAPIGSETKYYMSWNNEPTGMASSEVDLEKDFFYLAADNSLTIYHWKGLTPTYGKLVPTGNGGGSSSGVMVVTATHGRMGTNTQYVFDCDRSVNAIYEHIANGGIAVVKGSLAGNFQAILSGITLIEGAYCAVGVTEINNTLYTLSVKAPINSAQSTLYANQVLNKMFNTLDNRITENENNISELMYEMSTVKGASRFIPLSAVLTTSPTVSAGTLSTKKDNCTYEYVWSIPRKKLYIKETSNTTPPRVAYYGSWTEDILGISSDALDPMKCFFYSFGEDFMTIWHWKGDASTGELIPTGTDLTTINNYLSELSDLLGTIPSGVNTIGEFITDIQNRVTALENSSGGGGTDIDVDEALDETSTNPVENKAIKLAINHLQGQIDQLDPEGEIDDYDYASDPAYPEYSGYGNGGAKGDGIPYYDWSLACFNGFETDEVTIEETASDIEVFAPAERIMNKYGLTVDYRGKSMTYCSDSVIYNVATQQFLLKISNGSGYTYYNKWANSDVWNSDDTGKARRDTVFSDISEVPADQKTAYGYTNSGGIEAFTYRDASNAYAVAFRRSYIFKDDLEEPNLVEVYSTMTDDGAALADWFDARNGKVMKLRPGAIYYFRHIGTKAISHLIQINNEDSDALKAEKRAYNANVEENIFNVSSNTTVIGNGATLFPHRIDSGWPCKKTGEHVSKDGPIRIFYISDTSNASNINISNLYIKALRDKDGNAVGGESNGRFSTSSSLITAFYLTKGANNISITDIGTKNIDYFVPSNSGSGFPHDITIENVNCIGMLGQQPGWNNVTINNVYMECYPYIGHDGSHMWYNDCNNSDVVIKNSKFVSPDPYRETFITFHSGDPDGNVHHVYYENCVFEATGPLFGDTDVVAGKVIVHFKDCTISKTFETSCGNSVMGNAQYVFRTQYKQWEFIDCIINAGQGVVCDPGSYKLVVKNTTINSTLTSDTFKTLFGYNNTNDVRVREVWGYEGISETENIQTNYPGPLGVINNYDASQRVTDAEKELSMLKRLITGLSYDVPFRANSICSPSVGDKFFNISDRTLYECTAIGAPTTVGINLASGLSGLPYTVTQTIAINSEEAITFEFVNAATEDDIKNVITKTLDAAGYYACNNFHDSRRPGTYALGISSGDFKLAITSKNQGAFRSTTTISNSSNGVFTGVRSAGTPEWYKSHEGTNPTWQVISGTSGLIGDIEGLDSRVEALEG